MDNWIELDWREIYEILFYYLLEFLTNEFWNELVSDDRIFVSFFFFLYANE